MPKLPTSQTLLHRSVSLPDSQPWNLPSHFLIFGAPPALLKLYASLCPPWPLFMQLSPRLPEILSRILRQDRIDVKTGSPLEACNLDEGRHNFNMPVIMLHLGLLER